MVGDAQPDLTRLLIEFNAGRAGVTDQLSEAIHDHLRAMARRHRVRDFGPRMRDRPLKPLPEIF